MTLEEMTLKQKAISLKELVNKAVINTEYSKQIAWGMNKDNEMASMLDLVSQTIDFERRRVFLSKEQVSSNTIHLDDQLNAKLTKFPEFSVEYQKPRTK